jgi:ankyrin repeat protein
MPPLNPHDLIHASRQSNVESVQSILRTIDLDQNTLNQALVAAVTAEQDSPSIVAALLNHGANIEYRSTAHHGATPLLLAIANGHLKTLELLIDRNANLHGQDSRFCNALHVAAETGDPAIVQWVLSWERGLITQVNV